MDPRDIAGGLALIAIGAFATFWAVATLSLGTLSRMGPGMLPAAVGVLLVLCGVVILVPALFRAGAALDLDARSFVAVCLGIVAFASLARPFGLVPGIVALVLIASRADSRLSLVRTMALAVGFALVAILVFREGLGVQLAAFDWPW